MGIIDWFKSKNQSNPVPKTEQPTDPIVMEPFSTQTGRLVDVSQQKNKYSKADALINMDERLWSVVELSAIMVQKSYGGISLHTTNQDEGLSNREENAIEVAKEFAKTIDIPNLLYCYTKDLWKYGDAVDQVKFYGSQGIKELRPLPMNLVTAIDRRDQFRKNLPNEVIMDPKWYVVDEVNSSVMVKDQIIPKNRIMHISFDNRRQWTLDNMSRWTFNVWSHSPIETLRVLIEWKQNLIRNDIVWRNRLLPREHHKLDLSVYDPSKYTGTYATKVGAAKKDATTAIGDYNDKIKRREADQGFTTGQNVDIGIIEPKSTSYNAPNLIIDQINSLISTPTGTPGALVGGESKGFTSLLHSSSFTAMRADVYAQRIMSSLEELMKRHVRMVRPGISDEIVNRLYIKNRLILDRDRTELAKIIAVLNETNVFTPTEIRNIWGLDPLTEQQAKEISEQLKATQPIQETSDDQSETQEDLLRQNPASPTNPMETARQRQRNLIQKGDL